METEVKHGSELWLVTLKIHQIRYPAELEKKIRDWERYQRLAEGKDEVKRVIGKDVLLPKTETGVYTSKGEWRSRPKQPGRPGAYMYQPYEKSWDFVTHAREFGLLAQSLLNRPIRHERVEEYTKEMQAGRWRDLLSDPIAITSDGQVVNGQHRVAAAEQVDWEKVENDPAFLVIWDVDASEAQCADGGNRTERDRRVIAEKLLVKEETT